ncbi:TIGR02391 family protein [Roseomonas chloroacetimidivorans]|uniref:TIGR02391 family protein n=1 Tax=Roseomonas chloroacetimidivorans TaxID=1766656 RepID=UPI003C778ACA
MLDAELEAEISRLLDLEEFDSVIRKALVLLKTRMVRRFNLPADMDGVALANKVFGDQSELVPHLSMAERQSYRNLFAGIFGVLRNKYAHNHVKADAIETSAVVCSVNLCLKLVGDYRSQLYDVLVAEGDPLVLALNGDCVAQLGLTYHGAESLRDARRIIEKNGPPLLLITGRQLGGVEELKGGSVLAELVRSRNPSSRIIFATAAPFSKDELGPNDFQLRKPYSKEDLVSLISRAWREVQED